MLMISMPMCLSNSQDDNMPMFACRCVCRTYLLMITCRCSHADLSVELHADDSMLMCLSNSQDDSMLMFACLCVSQTHMVMIACRCVCRTHMLMITCRCSHADVSVELHADDIMLMCLSNSQDDSMLMFACLCVSQTHMLMIACRCVCRFTM